MTHSFYYKMFQNATWYFSLYVFFLLLNKYPNLNTNFNFTNFTRFHDFRKRLMEKIMENTKNLCIITKSSLIKTHDNIKLFLKNYNKSEEALVTINEIGENTITENKPPIRYEDKYLEKIRVVPDEYVLTEEEKINKEVLFERFFVNATCNLSNNIQHLKIELTNLQQELSDIENMEFNDDDRKVTYDDDGNELSSFEERIKEKKGFCIEQITKIKSDLISLNDTIINEEDIRKEVMEHIINERLDKLKNNFIIEKTPLGNVLMFYNNNKKSFEYYTDNSMPYRFLEVVSRKYVLTFNCRFLYVDMERELKNFESKLEEKEIKEKEQLLQKSETNTKTNDCEKNKKNVFVKFKSYNKQMGTGIMNKVPPPSNSIPNKNRNHFNEKTLLKEKANHYTCEGKFSNFNMLKKVDKKSVNKKYSMSFADFKKSVIHEK